MKNIEEANTNPFPKNLILKQSNTKNPFPKTPLLQQSNTTTKEKQRNQQTQDPPRVLLRSDQTWVLLELLGSDRNCEEDFAGVDQMISGSLSLCLVPYISFPTEAHLGFARIRSDLGFARVEFCWSLLKGKN